MENELLDRLEMAVSKLLEKNRRLAQECHLLQQERLAWQKERSCLLSEVDRILVRLDKMEAEER